MRMAMTNIKTHISAMMSGVKLPTWSAWDAKLPPRYRLIVPGWAGVAGGAATHSIDEGIPVGHAGHSRGGG